MTIIPGLIKMSAVVWPMTCAYKPIYPVGCLYVVKHVMVETNSPNLKAHYIPHGEGMSKFLKTKNEKIVLINT
jgi:hypothetical protein